MKLDTSPEACKAACALSDDPGVDFRFGDVVKIAQSCGRALEKEEEAIILGCARDKLWYYVTSQHNEDMEESASYAWYFDPAELPLLALLNDREGESIDLPELEDTRVAKDEFYRLLSACGPTCQIDLDLVRAFNRAAVSMKTEPRNVSPYELSRYLSEPLSPLYIVRATALRILNSTLMQCLPLVSFSRMPAGGGENTLGGIISHHRSLLFTSTKHSFFDKVLHETTTPPCWQATSMKILRTLRLLT